MDVYQYEMAVLTNVSFDSVVRTMEYGRRQFFDLQKLFSDRVTVE